MACGQIVRCAPILWACCGIGDAVGMETAQVLPCAHPRIEDAFSGEADAYHGDVTNEVSSLAGLPSWPL